MSCDVAVAINKHVHIVEFVGWLRFVYPYDSYDVLLKAAKKIAVQYRSRSVDISSVFNKKKLR